MLSELGHTQALEPTAAPDETQEQLKAMRRHLEWLQKEARAARNRLGTAQRSPWTPQEVIKSLHRTIKQLEEEVADVEDMVDEHIKANKELQSQLELLTTIPGVGKNTAIMVLTEMPHVQNCESSKTWVAFCGLNPEIRQSGKSSFSRLSRVGSSRIRAKLYMAAVVALRVNPLVKDVRQRLKARGKSGKLVVVAAMNKLIRLCYGVLRSGKPFDLSIHQQDLTP
jgi:transposase